MTPSKHNPDNKACFLSYPITGGPTCSCPEAVTPPQEANEQEQKLREEFYEKFSVWNQKHEFATKTGELTEWTPPDVADWWMKQTELARGQGILAVKEGKYPLSYSEWEAMGEKYQYDKFAGEHCKCKASNEVRADERAKVCAEVLEQARDLEKEQHGYGDEGVLPLKDLDTIVRNISQEK